MEEREKSEHIRARIAELYDEYYTETAIADMLGLTVGAVSYHVSIIKERIRKKQENHVAQRLARELNDLDTMEHQAIQRGKAGQARAEADHRLRIKQRRAKLLGFDQESPATPTAPGDVDL